MSEIDFLPFALPDIGEAEIQAVVETMRSGWLTTGPNSAAFEKEFGEALGGGIECVAVNSATAGLHLALDAIGIMPGDEVLVPTWTFTSTAEVVRYMGADPVMVDVDARTLNIDFERAAAAVTSRTKAIMPVHFAGLAVDRSKLADFASSHNVAVVEDAAHAFPVLSQGQIVGAGASDAVVFSFYATKTITTGEGGMVAVADPARAQRMRTMRLHGINRDVFGRYQSRKPSWQYEVVAPGFKYNLTDTAAAMGRVQLRRAEEMRQKRERIASVYGERLAHLPLTLPTGPRLPDSHGWHLYVVRVLPGGEITRDRLIERMADAGVGCSVHFIPLHKQPYWRDRYSLRDGMFPVATAQHELTLSIPIFSSMSEIQVERVVTALEECLA